MDMNEPVPWTARTNTMVGLCHASFFVVCQLIRRTLILPWHSQLFRGAQTGNREVLSSDNDFIWHPLTDFRITGWTGWTEAGQYVTLPAHCLHK